MSSTSQPDPCALRHIEAVFAAVLERQPTPEELHAWHAAGAGSIPASDFASSLKSTDEYKQLMVKQVHRTATQHSEPSVFFLHVPKSGGTAVDFGLRDRLNLPPLSLAIGSGLVAPTSLLVRHVDELVFPVRATWPYIKGHVPLSAAPSGYRILTFFREPVSRLLSLYRFIDSDHVRDFFKQRVESGYGQLSELGERLLAPEGIGGLRTFLDIMEDVTGLDAGSFAWMFAEGVSRFEEFANLSATDREERLRDGIRRIDACAWIHDPVAVKAVLDSVSPGQPLSRHNESPLTGKFGAPEHIDGATWDRLHRFASWDQRVLNLANECGILPELSETDAGRLIEATADRLAFTLPKGRFQPLGAEG